MHPGICFSGAFCPLEAGIIFLTGKRQANPCCPENLYTSNVSRAIWPSKRLQAYLLPLFRDGTRTVPRGGTPLHAILHGALENECAAPDYAEERDSIVTSMQELMGTVYRQSAKRAEEPADREPSPSSRLAVYMKRMENASCCGKVTGRCGETMEIFLNVKDEYIIEASFFTDGCRFSVLCGAVAALLAKGKTVDEAAQIDGESILGVLDKIPEDDIHCAYLAGQTLQAAIHDWILK